MINKQEIKTNIDFIKSYCITINDLKEIADAFSLEEKQGGLK